MHIPKNYFQDRMVLFFISANVFVTILSSMLVLLGLDKAGSESYIVQVRSNLGSVSAYKPGSSTEIISFILFAGVVLFLNTALSIKMYSFRRHYSITVLGMGLLLLILGLIVSNALLAL